MNDVLRRRILRRLETLPEDRLYQVLDFIEFLESRYNRGTPADASGLQRLAERLEDGLRKRTVNPSNLREAFQVISAADRVLSSVSSAGRQILDELQVGGEVPPGDPVPRKGRPDREEVRPVPDVPPGDTPPQVDTSGDPR